MSSLLYSGLINFLKISCNFIFISIIYKKNVDPENIPVLNNPVQCRAVCPIHYYYYCVSNKIYTTLYPIKVTCGAVLVTVVNGTVE